MLLTVGSLVVLGLRRRSSVELRTTSPTDAPSLDVIAPSEQPTLTLLTYTGWHQNQQDYVERIVIVARLRDNNATL